MIVAHHRPECVWATKHGIHCIVSYFIVTETHTEIHSKWTDTLWYLMNKQIELWFATTTANRWKPFRNAHIRDSVSLNYWQNKCLYCDTHTHTHTLFFSLSARRSKKVVSAHFSKRFTISQQLILSDDCHTLAHMKRSFSHNT